MLFRTDMADERHDVYRKAKGLEKIDGIDSELEEKQDGIRITRVKISNENGEKALGKKKGNYITIDIKNVINLDENKKENIIEIISNEIKFLVEKQVKKDEDVLVAGLGNENFVADALGSKVINNIEVTRHIKKYFPEFLKNDERAISAISPGVMGLTGIETIEMLDGIIENINPKLLIVIDSLASRSIERISKSIQISDTGIIPGAGVQNRQKALSEETLDIPVISIGIPTVIESAVIVNDSINLFIEKLQEQAHSNDYLNKLKQQDNYEEIKSILNPKDLNLVVTPKEIDELTDNMALLISEGINSAL